MSHKTQTTVQHTIELSDAEQFEHEGRRVLRIVASVVDGSLSQTYCYGRRILKNGSLGSVESEVWVFGMQYKRQLVWPILKAHGIKVPEVSS